MLVVKNAPFNKGHQIILQKQFYLLRDSGEIKSEIRTAATLLGNQWN